MGRLLTTRELGRTTLARQLLLERAAVPVVPAVHTLFGLNAQGPNLPYLALWSRLAPFAVPDLTAAITDGRLVRSTLIRATQHLMTASDFALLRPLLGPLLRRVQRNAFGKRTQGVDLDVLMSDARELLADGQVLTRPQLGRLLAERHPGTDATALGWTVQYLVPLIHPAPSGTWNVYGATPFALPASHREPTVDDAAEVVRRYLAAFGPATIADARAWSGISGLREVFAAMRPELRTYTDESGRELFDVPDAELTDPDAPAPVRFLPEFDAPLLAFADRTRVMTDAVRAEVCNGAAVAATVLVDGTVAATWELREAVLTVRPFRPLPVGARQEIEAEGARLHTFLSPDAAERDVRVLYP
ncbi:winged helix DNA-binding domain-containing protein [Cryptosporangium aurantiacum]|uniref:Winged helix DNA-binding domain-containing protein n=1 Tax=Cryptosporangium aurantiacum TaxID=134849 RepID=A0A1M7RDY5_9ACTN|nr:winged helix DNA-binding domain-containing protein [Cryptosporangium aurantiacum]SHN44359.1 Winged helix DNA-binding domain-containing protein [Cryptosporangium aurantiacum]